MTKTIIYPYDQDALRLLGFDWLMTNDSDW